MSDLKCARMLFDAAERDLEALLERVRVEFPESDET